MWYVRRVCKCVHAYAYCKFSNRQQQYNNLGELHTFYIRRSHVITARYQRRTLFF